MISCTDCERRRGQILLFCSSENETVINAKLDFDPQPGYQSKDEGHERYTDERNRSGIDLRATVRI